MKETFGIRLKFLRKERGLTQAQLAKCLAITRSALSKWETGTMPDPPSLIKLADFFDVTLDYLLCRSNFRKTDVFDGLSDADRLTAIKYIEFLRAKK
jgi:transcriptional regulator with XRE-family HTH domain